MIDHEIVDEHDKYKDNDTMTINDKVRWPLMCFRCIAVRRRSRVHIARTACAVL